MPETITKRRGISSVFKWMGRIGSIIILGGVLAFYLGEGGFNPFELSSIELVMMAFFWISCVGLVVAWKWEGIGGAISTLSMLAFFLVEYAESGRFPAGWAFEVIALPGLFFILAALLKGASPQKEPAEEGAA